jgi:predicted metal-dependent hydrolase
VKIRIWKFKKAHVARRRSTGHKKFVKGSRAEYLLMKEQARELVTRKLAEFNLFYNFKFNSVAIRNQRSRWGSCSRQGNLSFNYRLALVPEALVDYVVVHELCHLGEFNHSKDFWDLVAETIPDHQARRKQLHAIRFKHLMRSKQNVILADKI